MVVALQGSGANPSGVGSRVTLTLASGVELVREVSAGSGYFSQSSARAGFAWEQETKPEKLTVRWPDGEVTEQVVDPAVTLISISR